MIEFTQLEKGTPPDVLVTTDDGDAELAALSDRLNEAGADDMETYGNLKHAELGTDGKCSFEIPGDEVGELSDLIDDMPMGMALQKKIEEWTKAAQEKADAADE